jgi:hypothetical protein
VFVQTKEVPPVVLLVDWKQLQLFRIHLASLWTPIKEGAAVALLFPVHGVIVGKHAIVPLCCRSIGRNCNSSGYIWHRCGHPSKKALLLYCHSLFMA